MKLAVSTWTITRHGGLADDFRGRLVIEDGVLVVLVMDAENRITRMIGWPLGEVMRFDAKREDPQ